LLALLDPPWFRQGSRRKEAYEALHGKAKAIGANAANATMGRDASAKLADAFTVDTAAKTGQSERAVQRDAERGAKIDSDVLDLITGTHLNSSSYMDSITGLTKPSGARFVESSPFPAVQRMSWAVWRITPSCRAMA
jgi:ParB family chromosome partitioning protein